MSKALFQAGGLRFWSEDEIEFRELFQVRIAGVIRRKLLEINPAWSVNRCEGPALHPVDEISSAYSSEDVFVTNHELFGKPVVLRPETTPSSYAYARSLNKKLPLCVWQSGISFRRETNDGASAEKLRFNCFWQQEFQCIYSLGTKVDYREKIMPAVEREIRLFIGRKIRVVQSDRLPSYSESTYDIECLLEGGKWMELASCSIRTDYSDDTRVFELAIGLDRVVSVR